QNAIDKSYEKAYKALQAANVSLGIIAVQSAASADIDDSLSISYRSVMGVEIPSATTKNDSSVLPDFGLHTSNAFLDEAFINFNRVKVLTVRLAEIENSVYRLANAVKKTRKRANSLKNIVIPDFKTQIKFISEVLEEKEREEFSRLKVIKRRK
ncbi:MAG: V-type ATP synthase subunit D, partial [Clostridia bacterium]|nr:V-type ATP synthase subunit D [Clostridia bacterium]